MTTHPQPTATTASTATGTAAIGTAGCTGAAAGRGADLLVDALVAGGVTTLFGVPGDTGVVFYDALHQRADALRHVLARDERHAAAMADAYARAGNRVGVVEVSSGGGTTYAVGGLGEAYAAGVPVLLITSDIHSASRDTGALTEIDQTALFSAVTKWTRRAERAADLRPYIDPYDPQTWRSPADAMARRFYHWAPSA
ncbi:TcmI family type II polyketide cyclase [Streptomyces hainanensis]|uniref:TcmI family type II polyketide cyclase n=1 Tax=Streptomyces hainanensis TaxID=402648 RepID=UPI0014042844|nr:TcmI family type II polyketide cyclase [Streptomyces hainanensis]